LPTGSVGKEHQLLLWTQSRQLLLSRLLDLVEFLPKTFLYRLNQLYLRTCFAFADILCMRTPCSTLVYARRPKDLPKATLTGRLQTFLLAYNYIDRVSPVKPFLFLWCELQEISWNKQPSNQPIICHCQSNVNKFRIVIQTWLLSDNADRCSPQETVHQNKHPWKPGSGPTPRSVTGDPGLSDVICKNDYTDIRSCYLFLSNMQELAANNTSTHQLSDCIRFSHREGTLFLYTCEGGSSLTDVLICMWNM
jgi:hypothetical protein